MTSVLSNGTEDDLISSRFHQRIQTFVIPLTLPDLAPIADQLERISYGGHVWELRADRLQPPSSPNVSRADFIVSQLRILRIASHLPIIFTIRTVSQGGLFSDDDVDEVLELMLSAINEGCEYVEVQTSWPSAMRHAIFKAKGQSKLIASVYDCTGEVKWKDADLEKYIEEGNFGDILKISILATQIEDCYDLAAFLSAYRNNHTKPIVPIATGRHGQLSRILGPVSFVVHHLLPSTSPPGQLSLTDIHQGLHLMGQLPKMNFFIFGNNISHSLSPTIHNAAFAEIGLPYHYSIFQTPQMDGQVEEILQRPDFGGASVTFPHKLNIQSMLDSMSSSATKLGAVNTVVVQDTPSGRKLRGDNTDWLGILKCIRSGQKLHGQKSDDTTALVIGAGGAARAALFALQNVGIQQVSVVNRNPSNAEGVCKEFSSLKTEVYSSLSDAPAASIIVACIPADDITEAGIPPRIFADGPGIVIEMAYRPPITALMKVARRLPQWTVYGGVDVLRWQAYAQFELWTGWRAPIIAVEEALQKQKELM